MTLARLCRSLTALAAAALLLPACEASPAAPAANAPYSQTDLRVGAGISAATGNVLTVHYTGWIYDATKTDNKGLQFDTSVGTDPFTFTLGAGNVIAGWEQGLVGMKVGGLRKLIVPPSLGYGGLRRGPLPPNTAMVFEVELIEVKEADQ